MGEARQGRRCWAVRVALDPDAGAPVVSAVDAPTTTPAGGETARPERRHPVWLPPLRAVERSTAVVIALALLAGLAAEPDPPTRGYLAFAVGAVGAALSARHWRTGLVLVTAAPLLAVVLGSEPVTLWTTAVFTAFLMAARGRPAVVTTLVIATGAASAQWLSQRSLELPFLVTAGVAGAAALASGAAGSALQANHRYWDALDARARDAVAGRRLATERAVAEERLRIARDLHDSVGHAVAVVSMRLGAAQVQLPPGAVAAGAELAAAREGVQTILRETQQILAVLRLEPRDQEDAGAAREDDLIPTPDARAIPSLVEGLRSSGLDVRADLEGLDTPLPAQVGAAAHRIVQEALTNASKHGRGPVRLEVTADDRGVRIRLENRVAQGGGGHVDHRGEAGAPPTGGGRGLVGMRERATAAGGSLQTQQTGGGFVLLADLPTPGGAT